MITFDEQGEEGWCVLPASTSSCGLRRKPLNRLTARWAASYAHLARETIARHPPVGIVHCDGQPWLTAWHTRWLAGRVASVLRGNAAELIELADAAARPRNEETSS